MADESLEKYRKMRDDIVREFDEVVARLDELKAAGKFKTVTYKQLFARKMTLSAMLDIYREHGLLWKTRYSTPSHSTQNIVMR